MPLLITVGFEGIFSLSIILKLMTTFVPEGEIIPITNHSLIFKNYKENGFWRDLIAWIPVVFILDNSKHLFFRVFYFIKVIRIEKVINKFDSYNIMKYIK